MTSMTDTNAPDRAMSTVPDAIAAGLVIDVMIGVDTHVETHAAAVVHAGTGAVLDQITVEATAQGYAELVEFADRHAVLRAWAIEGTSSHGRGLGAHLTNRGEDVVELDRPERAKRRNARSPTRWTQSVLRVKPSRAPPGHPRAGGDRQALAVLQVARRSAVGAAGTAQRQLCSLVLTAPETLRAKFRAMNTKQMVRTAAKLRHHPTHDTETSANITARQTLARRIDQMHAEAKDLEKAITKIVTAWRPDLLEQTGIGPLSAAVILCAWSHPGRIRSQAAFAMLAGTAEQRRRSRDRRPGASPRPAGRGRAGGGRGAGCPRRAGG